MAAVLIFSHPALLACGRASLAGVPWSPQGAGAVGALCCVPARERGGTARSPRGSRTASPGPRPDGLPVPGTSAASVPTSADGMPHFKDPDPRVWHRHPVPWPAGISNLTAPRAPAQRGCVCESQARKAGEERFPLGPWHPSSPSFSTRRVFF